MQNFLVNVLPVKVVAGLVVLISVSPQPEQDVSGFYLARTAARYLSHSRPQWFALGHCPICELQFHPTIFLASHSVVTVRSASYVGGVIGQWSLLIMQRFAQELKKGFQHRCAA